MNLVLHHFRKDLRSQRVLLGLWLLLVLLQFGIAFWAPKADDQVAHALYAVAMFAVPALGSLLLVVLVPLLVLQEPLTGTSAFWLTRPLSRRQLLAAKSLFVAVLVVLPLLAQSVLLAVNGAVPREIGLGALQLASTQLSWVVLLLVLSIFASGFGRFAIIAAVYGLVVAAIVIGVYFYGLFRNPGYAVAAMQKLSLTLSRNLVDAALTVALGAAVVAHAYLTRNLRRSLFLALAAWAVAGLGSHFWPWDFLKPEPLTAVAFDAGPLRLSLVGKINAYDQPSLRGGTAQKAVNGAFLVEGLPPGSISRIRNVAVSLSRPGGETLKTGWVTVNDFRSGAGVEALEKTLGAAILNERDDGFSTQSLFSIDADAYAKDAASPLDFSARVEVEVARWAAQPDIPLRAGARWTRGAERLVVTNVLKQPDGVDVVAEERKLNLLYDRNRPGNGAMPDFGNPRVRYVLLNRKRGEAFVQRRPEASFDPLSGTSILTNRPLRLSFGPDQNGSDNLKFPVTPEWLADAVLVRLELETLGDVTKAVAVPGFRMDGKFTLPDYPENPGKPGSAELAAIVLPDHPGDAQIRDYVVAIFVASRRQSSWSDHDPQVAMIEKIGPGHAGILIDLLGTVGSSAERYLVKAIGDLAGPADKKTILAALPEHHGLIGAVNRQGWQGDVRGLIVSVATARSKDKPDGGWFVAAAALRDSSLYPALRTRLVEGPDRKEVYAAVRDLPGFDVAGAVTEAWKKARAFTGCDCEVNEMLPIAAENGQPDVLDAAARILRGKDAADEKEPARTFFLDFTPVPDGSVADVLAWYDAHRAELKFDPATKKFALPTPVQ